MDTMEKLLNRLEKIGNLIEENKKEFKEYHKDYIDNYTTSDKKDLVTADDYINEYDGWDMDEDTNPAYDLGYLRGLKDAKDIIVNG